MKGEVVPLFPLPQVVILPGVVMPFHIFEPRYIEMVESLEEGLYQNIAMSRLILKDRMDYYLTPEFENMGCLTEMVRCEKNSDGTYEILLVGLERITLEECSSSDERKYRCVEATPKPYPLLNSDEKAWIEEHEEKIISLLSQKEQKKVVHEIFSRWREGYLSSRALIHVFVHSLVNEPSQLQEILEQDSAELPIGILRNWLDLN